ncbi:tail fiber protein [Lelliottia phage phD2B]|uniref:Putative tail fiber protein n=1 Tax=Lelliottia phage phD2B TaxID=1542498 RepID=A0A088FWY8_9CAUD|nr:tail fiber protein [Lelliottia phage phD2B]AIM51264.1 putative tail fiber protein [Lelliottia phage phD2B]
MSFTFTEHTTDGIQTTFPFRFAGKDKAYLRASDIVVYLKVGGVWTEARNWALSGTNQITFTTAPAASTGTNLRIRRIVPKVDPYAEFARGVTLDMRSMNYAFIQGLQVTQELMDGFFPDGFFYKENLNMGFNKIINLAAGSEPFDAVNYTQLYTVDQKHTLWNQQQDMIIEGLKSGVTSGVSHRTIPWLYTASGGEDFVQVPYTFNSALVFINGVLQYEMAGAIEIRNNGIQFAEDLLRGDEVLVLVGSRIASPEDGVAEINIFAPEGATTINLNVDFSLLTVFLDGLKQPITAYEIVGQTVVFKEPLPECMFSALVVVPKGGANT